MKKTILPFKKKLKQFKKLINLLTTSSSEKVSREIKRLFAQLSFQVPSIYLKRTLVGSALAIALLSGVNISAQEYKSPVLNPFNITDIDNTFQPVFFDIDGDGDLDLLSLGYYGNHQVFKNTGTKFAPNFIAPSSNPNGLTSTGLQFTFVTSGDIDHDGDIDLLEMGINPYSYGQVDFTFVENTGTATAPNFTAAVTNPFGLSSDSAIFIQPRLLDVDKDGDLDIMTSVYSPSSYYGAYKLYRNTGTATAPSFAAPMLAPFNLPSSIPFGTQTYGDIDRDGDEDFLYADFYGQFTLYKDTSGSTGDPAYSSIGIVDPYNLTFSDETVRLGAFVDIDGDNDLDFFANNLPDTTTYMGGLWFFKDTLSHVGIIDQKENELAFNIYPQPVISELNIDIITDADKKSLVTITDAQGRIVLNTELVTDKNILNVQSLQKGMYTIQIENEKYKGVKKFIKF